MKVCLGLVPSYGAEIMTLWLWNYLPEEKCFTDSEILLNPRFWQNRLDFFFIVFIHLFIYLMAFWSLLGEPFQACPARRRPPGKTQDSLGRLYLSAGLGTIWYQPTEIGAPKTLAQISGRGSEERWMDGILHLSLLFYMKISGCKHSGSFLIYISCLCAVWVVLTNHIWPGLGCMQVKLSM